ncbi:MAG: type VI secretion system membrane subunit TssM [Alcaligenaceae bacterium]|nr:type VI secretion system membrane subunit TssM [Alcaligenaceae bacterium]
MRWLIDLPNRIFSFIFSRGLWTFFGLVILSWLIWYFGPSVAVGQWYPLEDRMVRIYLISGIFALWLLRLIWRKWREGRLNAQLLGQIRKPKNEAALKNLPVEEQEEIKVLSERFDEAVALLKHARFEQGIDRSPLARFSKQYLYQLPWYVFIGAPGSGKTTALINSGLNFPLAEKFGKVALKGVGGTRNCDWWFTDEAVLLDTAGRYTTHESDPTGDEKEWKGFLSLLSKYRGRQPINGVMLTVSIADLLSANATDRAQHALVLKQRLQELRDELGIEFPVYVLVTKLDLLSGFESYFDDLSMEEMQQVWGFTIPYEQSQTKDFELLPIFDREYQLLQERLFDSLPDVLMRTGEDKGKALAYSLPQQFANLRMILGSFLSDVFSSSKFEQRVIPRGVYFTSGTQGGLGFDKVAGELKRYMRLDGIQQSQSMQPGDGGKSFFLRKLLQDVVFQEAGLAGLNLKWERRKRKIQWSAYAVMASLLVIALATWGNSYFKNKSYLAHVEEKVPPLQTLSDEIKITQEGDVLSALPFLNSTLLLADGPDFKVDNSPWSYHFGLYQGNKIKAAAKSVYQDALKNVLLPQVAKRVEASLRHASPADLELSYEALRAYLMMYEPARYDAAYMKTWILADLNKILPANFTTENYNLLEQHIDNLVGNGVLISPFPKDENLVSMMRDNLNRVSIARRAYSRIERILTAEAGTPISVSSLGGSQAPSVFRRTSGKPLNQGVPAFFSFNGYWNVFDKRVERETVRLREDDVWILDAESKALGDGSDKKLVEDVRVIYFNEYVKHWDEFLADVEIIVPDTLVGAIELARTLSSSNSPLTRFVQSVANETTLLRADDQNERSIVDRARERATSTTSSLTSIIGPVGAGNLIRTDAGPERLEELVDRHFVQYRELATSVGQNTPPPIESTVGLLNELYTYLTAADTALRTKATLPSAEVISKLQAESGRLPPALGTMLQDLSVQASSSVNSVQQSNMGEDVDAILGNFCRRAIAGRYPFSNSAQDIAPNDFARFFAHGQMMDDFFQKNLSNLVDMSVRPWRFKPGVDGSKGGIARFLSSFEQASIIRDVYFSAGSHTPSYKVAIRPLEMDPGIMQFILDVDGQVMTYEHGPQVGITVDWPGQRGSNQVSMSASPQQGTSGLSTSGPWALNRLLDRASLRQGRSPEVTIATFSLGGRNVTLEFTAYSAKSPFRLSEMRNFVCPGRN